MRYLGSPIWGRWRSKRYVGDARPRLVVTWEPDWWLTISSHTNKDNSGTLGLYPKGPVRWWQRKDGSQYEVEVPNVISLNWNRSVETPVGDATITIANQKMVQASTSPGRIGDPGHMSPRRGGMQTRPVSGSRIRYPYLHKQDRWGQDANDWYGAFNAGSVFRTYEGYGPPDKPWEQAVEDGDIVPTGVWMCDDVSIAKGTIEMKCRGVAGPILADQRIYSNSDEGIIPRTRYPLRYYRYNYGGDVRPGKGERTKTIKWTPVFSNASTNVYYPENIDWSRGLYGRGAPVHGHYPDESADGVASTYWLSEGYLSSDGVGVRPWVQYVTFHQMVNDIYLQGLQGNMLVYISIMEGGTWVGSRTIPYIPGAVNTGANIPYVTTMATSDGRGLRRALSRIYYAEEIRLTFRKLPRTPWGPDRYRAGVREFYPALVVPEDSADFNPHYASGTNIRERGNYADYLDIVKDLLLWSGYWLLPNKDGTGRHKVYGQPEIYGNLESTGAWSEEHLPAEMFDKRPPLDVLTEIADVVGYLVMEGPEGEIHFHSRNIWGPGNKDENGRAVSVIPELHDAQLMTDFAYTHTVTPLRTGITISTAEPTAGGDDVITTRVRPDFKTLMRGVRKPAIWVNGFFVRRVEQQRMAQLTALRMWMAAHVVNASSPGNPLISPDDQVRVVEQASSVDDIYYVRGISSNHDRTTNIYTMDYELNYLGNPSRWAIGVVSTPPAWRTRQRYLVREGDTWEIISRRIAGRYYGGFPGDAGYVEAPSLSDLKAMNVDKVPFGEEPDPGIFLDV